MNYHTISEPVPMVAVHAVHPGERLSFLALSAPEDAAAYMRGQLAPCVVEHLVMVTVGVDLRPTSQYLIAKGCKDRVEFSMADLLRAALLTGAESVMIFHNHTSGGRPVPSEADLTACRRIHDALALVGIQLLDFLIVSAEGKEFSFLEERISVFSPISKGGMPDEDTELDTAVAGCGA